MKRLTKITASLATGLTTGLTTGLAGLASLVFVGQLYAQPAPANQRVLSDDEMSRRAPELAEQVRVDLKHVQNLQTAVRNEKDVIKLSCVNDKFVALKAGTNVFDSRLADFTAANKGNRTAAYQLVVDQAGKTHKVRQEADECIGNVELGDQANSEFTSPDIVDDPTNGLPFDDFNGGGSSIIEPPAYASPFA
jgi:hypothetical protein